jgi:hypothetical protein
MLVLEIERQQAEGKRVAFRAGAVFARSLILAWSRYTSPTAFLERTGQQVGHTEHRGIDSSIVPVQLLRLDADNAKDVAPLTVRDSSSLAIPTQLLQQNIFRRMHVEGWRVRPGAVSTARRRRNCCSSSGVPPATKMSTFSCVA